MTSEPPEMLIGTRVASRYRLTGILGLGGMGTVYRAVQESLDREVALKVIHSEPSRDETVRRRFLREARVAASFRHPNAVEIYDFGESNGMLFMAMELLRGRPLRAFVDSCLPPLTVRRACGIGREIADVLAAAAGIDLVHRDLKPENVMMDAGSDGTERVVVVDFGLAFRTEHTAETGRITSDGVSSGTPDYMSPEQIRGLPSTPAADVYALGGIMYEMLTARAPFASATPALTLTRHLFTAPPSIRDAHPQLEIPAELDELVLAMLYKKASERPSAVAVRDVLRRFEVESSVHTNELSEQVRSAGRAARMVSIAPTVQLDLDESLARRSHVEGARFVYVSSGTLDEDVVTSLAAHDYRVTSSLEAAHLVVVLTYDPVAVEKYVSQGHAVVAEVDATHPDEIAALLRAGATDVLQRPIDPAALVRRLDRALRKAARRG